MFKPVTPLVDFDFPKLERKLLDKWYKNDVVQKYLHKNDGSKKQFSFLDGPITANNPMGVHHAWGRTYKDLWQRFFNMRGFRQRFQNGFDEQGLWVEVEVEKELGLKNKKDIENLVADDKFKSLEKFINLCKERVKKYSQVQTEQSKRLGYFMDWDNSYHTSSDENNYAIWNFLKVVNEKGWLYKGHDSVPWCPRCGTAISQHEILTEDYKEISHESVYFKLPIKDRENEYLIVWTTTPWTIPANVAVAVDPKKQYLKIKADRDKFVYLMEERAKALGFEGQKVKGVDLVGLEYDAPFDHLPRVSGALGKYVHRVIKTDDLILSITDEEGTGLVHVAPGAGSEDFKLGKKLNLPVIELIDEEANYLDEMEEFSGKNAKKHPELIIDFIKDKDGGKFLFKTERIKHRYPNCWRCKTELVWRVVDEWYIAMDKKDQSGKSYRQQMVEAAKKINWIPKWGLDRELDWLKNMHDWLISKKRYWGLALPIWECQKCGNFQVIGSKEELKEKTVEGLSEFTGHSPHRPWVDQVKIKCSKCGGVNSRIPDVGSPWLDAGIVPFSTMPQNWFPADFITESFPGQFKNWFYSLIAMATALKNTNPFKTVLGFASVRDEKGEEMHKSKGNAIEFNEAADKIGVDVMRWMYVTQNPELNLNFGYHVADETRRRFHLMLWNVYNFFITYANIDKWQVSKSQKKAKSQNILDQWILSRLNNVIKLVTDSLGKFDAYSSCSEIEKFVSDLSLWYVRRSRDRVGPSATDEGDKNICYETFYQVLVILTRLLAPFTPFMADEMHTNLTGKSVHLSDWPIVDQKVIDEKLEQEMQYVRQIIELGHAKRKEHGMKVRQPLKKLKVKSSKFKVSEELMSLIEDELNVKQVEFVKGGGELEVELDTKITSELKEEGEAREMVRMIQDERKKLGTRLSEQVDVTLPSLPKGFAEEIKRKALVRNLSKGAFKVTRFS